MLQVELIAHTMFALSAKTDRPGYEEIGYIRQPDELHDTSTWVSDGDQLGELAGRLCYLSWHRPNKKTARNEDYLANIISQQHFSVLEHASASFYLGGVSRSFTHELIRHRHLSFSQVSQRYVDESEAEFIEPPALLPYLSEYALTERVGWDQLESFKVEARHIYEDIVQYLVRHGKTRKQAREAARSVLPNATATQILVTGSFRAWREFLAKRTSPHADAEMQLVAKEILRQLLDLAPNSFQDLRGLAEGVVETEAG